MAVQHDQRCRHRSDRDLRRRTMKNRRHSECNRSHKRTNRDIARDEHAEDKGACRNCDGKRVENEEYARRGRERALRPQRTRRPYRHGSGATQGTNARSRRPARRPPESPGYLSIASPRARRSHPSRHRASSRRRRWKHRSCEARSRRRRCHFLKYEGRRRVASPAGSSQARTRRDIPTRQLRRLPRSRCQSVAGQSGLGPRTQHSSGQIEGCLRRLVFHLFTIANEPERPRPRFTRDGNRDGNGSDRLRW
jgi:hypothetical protein